MESTLGLTRQFWHKCLKTACSMITTGNERFLESLDKSSNEDFSFHSYDDNGNIKVVMEIKPPAPTRLAWDFKDPMMVDTIDEAFADARKIINVSTEIIKQFP